MKNYDVLNELVPKTQELHRAIFDKGYEQGQKDILEQQPCKDCISRQMVLDGLASIAKVKARSDAQKSLMGRIMFFVEQLPPVTPKEKTAAWVSVDAEPHDIYECNACGWLLYYEDRADFKYCPNCGARMVSE